MGSVLIWILLLLHYVISPTTVLGESQPFNWNGHSSVILRNCRRDVAGDPRLAIKVNVVPKHVDTFHRRIKLVYKSRVVRNVRGERFVLYTSDHRRWDGVNELLLGGRWPTFVQPDRFLVASPRLFSLDKRELFEFDADGLVLVFPQSLSGEQNLPVFTGTCGRRMAHRAQSTNLLMFGDTFPKFNQERDFFGGGLADICSNDVNGRPRFPICVDSHWPGKRNLGKLKPWPRADLRLLLNRIGAVLRRFRLSLSISDLLLSKSKLPLSSNTGFGGVPSSLSRTDVQKVGLMGHFIPLPPKHNSRSNDGNECSADENSANPRPPERELLKVAHVIALVFVGWWCGWLGCDLLLESGRLGSRFERFLWNFRGRGLSEGERFLIGALGFLGAVVLSAQAFIIVAQKYLTPSHLCTTVNGMANVLPKDKQIAIIGALAEGSSIRSIERITGIHRDTIMRLGVRVGQNCGLLLDSKMQDLGCNYLQFDEVWGFIGKKERHVGIDDDPEMGDVWTYCAIDSETKLVPAFKCGKRTLETTTEFVQDVASRMRHRVQVSSDAMHSYVEAMERGFGADVDYGQCVKVYSHDAAQHPERKYSAPRFANAYRRSVTGMPEMEFVSTSHVERLNATTRLHVKRLSRLTLAFSKKLDNFKAAVALHFAYYNFVRRHATLRCTPAMAAGIERDFWTVGDLVEATS